MQLEKHSHNVDAAKEFDCEVLELRSRHPYHVNYGIACSLRCSSLLHFEIIVSQNLIPLVVMVQAFQCL